MVIPVGLLVNWETSIQASELTLLILGGIYPRPPTPHPGRAPLPSSFSLPVTTHMRTFKKSFPHKLPN